MPRGKKVRVRCPCCGMLVWQSRLNKKFPFEFVIQETSSAGRGQIRNRYHRGSIANSEGARAFQAMLALKMIEQAREMLDDVGAGVRVEVIFEEDEAVQVDRDGVPQSGDVEESDTVVYEVGYGGTVYEIEVKTELETVDLKRAFWRRFRRGRKGRPVREMEQVELDFDSMEVEIDYDDEED